MQTEQVAEFQVAPDAEGHAQAVCGLREAGVAAFTDLSDDLGRIRELHMAICGNLKDFADLVAAEDTGSGLLSAVEQALTRMADALRFFVEGLGRSGKSEHLASTRAYLKSIERSGRTLTVIATLTRTTAASLDVRSLGRYLSDLSGTARDILQAAKEVGDMLEAMLRRAAATQDSCSNADTALATLLPRLAEGRDALQALGRQEAQAAQALASRARTLAEDGRSHIKTFVTAMQFSDRLAQRLEHVRQMLEHDEGQVDGHVARLAAAHARRSAEDIRAIAQEVAQTMFRLADMGRKGAALFSEGDIADAISATLDQRSALVAMVQDDMARFHAVMEGAQRDARHAAEAASAASDSFARLGEGSKTLAVASINSMLLSTRSGDNGAPLIALSADVRQTAARCLAAVGGGQAALNALLNANGTAQDNLFDAVGEVDKAVAAYGGVSEAGNQRLERINALRAAAGQEAAALLALVARVEGSMAQLVKVGEGLVALSRDLDLVPTQGDPDPAMLARIWAIYTMDEERVVHAELFAAPQLSEDALAASEGGDDLDDLLF